MSGKPAIHRASIRRLAQQASWLALAAGMALGGGTAYAQNAAAGRDAASSSVLEEIMVTGSRIQRTGMNTPTPVTSLDLGELSNMAPGNLIESMSQLPQFVNNTTTNQPNGFFNSPGSGALNLRGLGSNRTLVLLNGRRMPSSSKDGIVDINLIPSEMIRRVDTVTGGASAAYGTDAVAGVVNFILDTDFTGLSGHVQGGISQRGDNGNWEASATFGHDIGDRGHIILSAEAARAEGIFSYEGRDWYKNYGLVDQGGLRVTAPNVVSTQASFDGIIRTPYQVTLPDMTTETRYDTPLDFMQFNSDGTLSPFVFSDLTGNSVKGAPYAGPDFSQSIASGGSGTDPNADMATLVPQTSRVNAYTYLDFDVSDNVNVYFQGMYGENHLRQTNLGGYFGQTITIFKNNAFLPDSVNAAMDAAGIDSFTMGRVGHSSDLAQNAWTTMENKTFSGTLGFDADVKTGGLFDGWKTGAYYQYSKVHSRNYQWGGIRLDRIYLALDAVKDPVTGSTVCNVTLVSGMYPDCVPLNLFGRGNASQAAIDWVTGMDQGEHITTPLTYGDGLDPSRVDSYDAIDAKQYLADITQHVAEWTASGEVWEGWGAGPVSAAVGLSYRKESIDQVVRDSSNPTSNNNGDFLPVPSNDAALGIRGVPLGDAGNTVGIQFSKVPNIRGSLNTKEAFGELLVPLYAGDSFLRQVNGDFAIRYADYSGSGGIWAWKAGLDADLDFGLRLRGTVSRDVRAATLSERFNQTGGTFTLEDPFTSTTHDIFIVSGGNPNVKPEKSDTITLGAVYQPDWLDGFGVSVDWYQLKIKDALGTVGTQIVVDNCAAGDQTFCNNIVFDGAPGASRVNVVNNGVVNISSAEVSGIDFEASYRSRINLFGGGAEMLSFRGFASYLIENSTTSAGGTYTDLAGQAGGPQPGQSLGSAPQWKGNLSMNYTNGGFSLFVQERYIGSGFLNQRFVEGVSIDNNHVRAAYYTDLRLSYTIEQGSGQIEIFGNVTNLFDEAPPITASFSNFGANANQTNPALHDVIGQRFVGGVRFRY